ncbi:4'-phosphopantetheinyl transferase family protein [Desulfobacula toluolica]|uniref:Putative 4\'-phosphopantetheinyl transferase n=1 Tax=Desulfobacula toluolica (strain DSM 7467 / Tol2) TaxID=651182 RepID=K0N5M0_DESTT|nr:4'-phosphopantetheinyl transferase superfamily protein [Desulfobacula toluolica]CCK79354.1 putative 4\'-phosphopantetheinyl transferase [Desulfobacula toluolica Tol2]
MPEDIQVLKRKNKVAALSRFAMESAKASALKSTFLIDRFIKDDLGVPEPSNGCFWSVSHKPDFVAGVVSIEKIGIDVEQIKDVSEALFKKIVDPDEAGCFRGQDKKIIFFRVFTAKEAVLKKTTDGLKGMSKVKIKKVHDDNNIILEYLNTNYLVENFYFDGYLASVTKDRFDVQWALE